MSSVVYVCLDCKGLFIPHGIDALCPACRAKHTARQAKNVTCPRCGQTKRPAAWLCDTCSTDDLVSQTARYGSD